tara:strand:- start:547 stop:987 length:441 start_codon:yes stop_codon:yes gene_type:complete
MKLKYRDKPKNSMKNLKARFFYERGVKEHLKEVGMTGEVHGLRLTQRLKLINEDYFKDYVERYFFRPIYQFGTSKKIYDFALWSWVDRDSEEGLELEKFHYYTTFETFYNLNISKYYKNKQTMFKNKRITLRDRLKKNGGFNRITA